MDSYKSTVFFNGKQIEVEAVAGEKRMYAVATATGEKLACPTCGKEFDPQQTAYAGNHYLKDECCGHTLTIYNTHDNCNECGEWRDASKPCPECGC